MKHQSLYTNEDSLGYLERVRSGKIKEASRFGHREIDDFLRFKQGNFIVVTGHANVGKTHMIMYLNLLHTRRNGTKWLIFSSENDVGSLQRKLIEFAVGKPVRGMEDREFYNAHAFIMGHYDFIRTDETYDIFGLLETCAKIHAETPYQGLLIDPYNSLTINQKKLGKVSEHQYHYEATSHIRVFCKTHNVMVILNTHPSTEALRRVHSKGHQYEGHPMPPMAADVEGGGKFVNRSDEFYVIHRYPMDAQDWIYTDIHVRKVKDIETGGRPTSLHEPIRMESMKNNVGFSIGYKNLLHEIKPETDVPF